MKIRKYQSSDERAVLTGMILNDEVLKTIFTRLGSERHPFPSKWSNLIARWCLDYFDKYRKAPKDKIQNRFAHFVNSNRDSDVIGLVEDYLVGLSSEAERSDGINSQFTIDTAARLFNEVRYSKLTKSLVSALETKDIEKCGELYDTFEQFRFAAGQRFRHDDNDRLKRWMERKGNETLIEWPQGLGKFFGRAFQRDSFLAFAGPEKRGKSYWLQEVVYQALKQRRRVLYYVVGDMSEDQAMQRLYSRIARRPLFEEHEELRLPKELIKKKDGPVVQYHTKKRRVLTYESALAARTRFEQQTGCKVMRLVSHFCESSTVSATDIENHHEELAKEDWVPDLTVIDYADILDVEPSARDYEYRHQVNETWERLRRIAQRYHLCLVTATQTAATSYDANLIRKRDFSEDKRKAAHVSGMLGINQTADEKRSGIYRLNWIVLREGNWSDNQVVHTAGNLAIGCPCIVSSVF